MLDDQLPRGGGPMASRLAAAERELAALEDLAPLDSRHAAARQDADATARRAAQAEEDLRAARRAWREGPGKGRLAAEFLAAQRPPGGAPGRPHPRHAIPPLACWTKNLASAAASATCSTAAWPNWWPIAASRSNRSIPWKRSWSFPRCSRGKRPASPAAMSIRRRLRKLRRCAGQGRGGHRPAAAAPQAVAAATRGRKRGASASTWWPRPRGSRTCATNTSRSSAIWPRRSATGLRRPTCRQHLEGPAAAHLDASRDDLRARLAGIEKEIHPADRKTRPACRAK